MFIVGSATTNALFLSSIGRTSVEAWIYGGLSIAADLAKVVLPVAIALAVTARAWLQAGLAGMLLVGVIALSLASGTGFAALTRGSVSAAREAIATKLAGLEADRAALGLRLSALTAVREPAVIGAALEAAMADRRWQATRRCTDANTPTLRQYCAEAQQLRVEQVAAAERDRLAAEERALRAKIEALSAGGATVSADPQVEALATLIGVSPGWLRAALGVMLAAVLELGAVVLVLLIAGPLLRAPAKPEPVRPAEPPEPEVMRLPPQVDRTFWQRQRNRRQSTIAGGSDEH
jgi:hypothetical protein